MLCKSSVILGRLGRFSVCYRLERLTVLKKLNLGQLNRKEDFIQD